MLPFCLLTATPLTEHWASPILSFDQDNKHQSPITTRANEQLQSGIYGAVFSLPQNLFGIRLANVSDHYYFPLVAENLFVMEIQGRVLSGHNRKLSTFRFDNTIDIRID